MDNTDNDKSIRKILDKQHNSLKEIASTLGDMGLFQIEQIDILKSIEAAAKMDKFFQVAQVIEEKKIKDDEDQSLKESHEMNEHLKKIEQALLDQAHADNIKEMAEIVRTAVLSEHALNVRTFKTELDKRFDFDKSMEEKFGSISKTLDTLNIVKKGTGGFFSDLFQKREDRSEYVKTQTMLGSTKSKEDLSKDYEKYLIYAKQIQKNEEKLEKFRKLGLSDVEIEKTPKGKELLQQKTALSTEFSKYDIRSTLIDDGHQPPPNVEQPTQPPPVQPNVEPNAQTAEPVQPTVQPTVQPNAQTAEPDEQSTQVEEHVVNIEDLLTKIVSALSNNPIVENVKSSATTFADNMSNVRDSLFSSKIKSRYSEDTQNTDHEAQVEQDKYDKKIEDILEEIAENTRPSIDAKKKDKDGGFSLDGIATIISSILDVIKTGLVGAFSTFMKSGSLLKMIGKGFVLADVVLSIGNGFIEGFKEWSNSGDFKKAFRAGLGGMVEFLTMGLISKEDYKEYGVWFDKMVDENIVAPIKEFFSKLGTIFEDNITKPLTEAFDNVSTFFHDVVADFMNIIKKIGIPEIDISALSKWIPGVPDKIGPWYPFADEASAQPNNNAEQVQPNVANIVYGKSTENVDVKESMSTGGGNTVISAPTVNNNSKTVQNNSVTLPVRNPDTTSSRYIASRYAV